MALTPRYSSWGRAPLEEGVIKQAYLPGLQFVGDFGSVRPKWQQYITKDARGFQLYGTRTVGPNGPGWLAASAVFLHARTDALSSDALWETSANSNWTVRLVIDSIGIAAGTNPGFWRSGDTHVGNTFVVQNGSSRRPWVRVNGADILKPTTGPQWTAGQTIILVVRFTNASRIEVWWDGELKHSASHSTSQDALTGVAGIHALMSQGANETTSGVLVSAWAWNTLLDDRLTEAIAGDVWAPYEPQIIMVPVSAGSATNLVIADASHAHAADNLDLALDTTLAINDATHAHSADAPTLTTEWLLTVADATHAHAAESPTLSTEWLLSVQDALHGHAADNVVLGLTGAADLLIADAAHGHSVDGLTLTTDSVLALQDALHAHAADNLDQSDTPALLIADGLHAHTSDGLVLTVDAWLVVADALHGQLVDNIVLTGTGIEPIGDIRAYTIHSRGRRLEISSPRRRLEISRGR